MVVRTERRRDKTDQKILMNINSILLVVWLILIVVLDLVFCFKSISKFLYYVVGFFKPQKLDIQCI